jgi:transposase-like protein
MDKNRLDIVSIVEPRRKWPVEQKARIMEKALAPGAGVADCNGIARSQVYASLRKARADKLPGISVTLAACAAFVPVQIEPPVYASPLPAPLHSTSLTANP